MASRVTKELFLKLSIGGDKQLKEALAAAKDLAKIMESVNGGKGSEEQKKQLKSLVKVIEELRNEKEKDVMTDAKISVKKLKFTKLELQKQKELLKQEKESAKKKITLIRAEEQARKKQADAEDRARERKSEAEKKEREKRAIAEKKEAAAEEKAREKKAAAEERAREKAAAAEKRAREKKAAAEERVRAKQAKAYLKTLELQEKQQKQFEEEERLLSKEAETYLELAAQTSLLIKQRKEINITTKDGMKAFNKLGDTIKENNDQLKDYDERIGNFQRSVGNYEKALKGLKGGVTGIGSAFKVIASIGLVALFSLLIKGIMLLGKAFGGTAQGVALTNKLMAASGAAMRALESFAVGLFNVLKSGSDSAIAKGINKAFEAGTKILGGYVEGLKKVAKFIAPDLYAKVAKEAEKANEVFKENLKIQELILQQRMNVRIANRAIGTQIEKLAAQEEILREKAGETLRTDAEKIKLSKQANEILDQKSKLQRIAAENELRIAKNELAAAGLNIAAQEDARDRIAEIQGELIEIRKDATIRKIQNDREAGEAARDSAERELDVLIDIGEDRLKLIDDELAKEGTTFQQRQALLTKRKETFAKNYEEQKAIVERFAKGSIDIDAAVKDSNTSVTRTRLKNAKVDDIIAGRIIEIIRSKQAAESEASKIESENKKKAIEDSIALYEKEQELELLKFESEKRTAEEKAIFELGQQVALNEEKLRIRQEYDEQLTELDQKLLEQKIANDEAEIASKQKLGIGLSKVEKERIAAINKTLDAVINAAGEETKVGKALGLVKKALAIKDTIISITKGIAQTASVGFPQNIPLILGMVAQTAGLIGTIKSVKFADGGQLPGAGGGIAVGASHANGGIPIPHLNSEIEGGELVLTKGVARNPEALALANAANTMVGGADLMRSAGKKFASGGILPSQDANVNTQVAPQVIIERVTVVEDIVDIMNDMAEVATIQEGL